MTNRVFTDQELKEMGARTVDLLTAAIESGDKTQARALAERMYQETLKMHDMYVDWTAGFMDWIYKNGGDEALLKAEKKVFGDFTGNIPDMRKVPFKLRVMGTVNSLRGHQQVLKIEEDDEKVCITMMPCGSGERLYKKGSYGPPCNLSMIKKAQVMTAGKTDFPVYCTHEPVLELLAIEKLGYPVTICYAPEKVARGGSCIFCIYKDFKDVPEEVWKRAGKEKPKDL